jgi:hypothetical protein
MSKMGLHYQNWILTTQVMVEIHYWKFTILQLSYATGFQLQPTIATENLPNCLRQVAAKLQLHLTVRIWEVYTVGLYNFIHPYSILTVVRATTCNYRGCIPIASYVLIHYVCLWRRFWGVGEGRGRWSSERFL